MRSTNFAKKLLGASSLAALSVGVAVVPAVQASAQDTTTSLFGGGSSLSSNFFRQVFDCYAGREVAGDGISVGAVASPTTPNQLPASCGTKQSTGVIGLFASVGSGRGQQAFFADDATQLVNGGTEATGAGIGMPGLPPLYIDGGSTSGTVENIYPYPELDFAFSDSPLASAVASLSTTTYAYSNSVWATATASGTTGGASTTFVITGPELASVSTAAYNTAAYGLPIQIPAFEVPVALAVNTSGMDGLLTANAQSSVSTAPGNAIELNTAQVCAIFAGAVTNWNDSTTLISMLDSSGTQGTELFDAANVSSSITTGQPYATSSLPIIVNYRSDGSGTSFIITNYLKSSCVQLGTTANHYSAIFSTGLPSTNFSVLLTNIVNNGGSTAGFVGETGTQGVAAAVGFSTHQTTQGGNIGYISNDFTAAHQPFTTSSSSPQSASVQNEAQRVAGIDLPTGGTFIPPTPAAANLAYTGLTAPTDSAFNDWNLYGQTYAVGNTWAGNSILGIPETTGAYPLVGTTFMMAYGCYNGTTKANKVKNFLTWYFNANGTGSQAAVQAILSNSGFNTLNTTLLNAVKSQIVNSSTAILGTGCGTGA